MTPGPSASPLRRGVTGEARFLAAAASLRIADFDVAWEQAILAAQAGHRESMERLLDSLRELSDVPEDLQERLRAPRVPVEAPSGMDPATDRTVRQALAEALLRGEERRRP